MKSSQIKTCIAYAASFLPFFAFVPMVVLSTDSTGWFVAFWLYLVVWSAVWFGFSKEIEFLRPKHVVLGVIVAMIIQIAEGMTLGVWSFRDQHDVRSADRTLRTETVEQSPGDVQ